MRNYRKAIRAVLAVSAACAFIIPATQLGQQAASAAPKSIVFSDAPGTSAPPSTLGPYSMTPFGPDSQAVDTSVSSVAGPSGTVGFSPSLGHCLVGGCWNTWSNGYTGDVYTTTSQTITLTLPVSARAFYFYAETQQFSTFSITATTDQGTTSGPIAVNGEAGAEYFGFYATGADTLKTITVTGADPTGFAIGEFGVSACTYNTPASWTTSPVAGLTPGVEPLNVIISGCSNVSLEHIREGLGDWGEVSPSCLSAEKAKVTGSSAVNQQQSWRLEGSSFPFSLIAACVQGNILSLSGDENHARIWNQPIQGTSGAWFISASYETACVDDGGTMVPARDFSLAKLALYKALGLAWHCIDGSQGSIGTDGYNRGAQDLVSDIQAAAATHKWNVDVQTIQTPAGTGEGHDGTGVPFDGTVYVVTVDTATP